MTYEELNIRILSVSDEVNGRTITQESLDELLENAKQLDHSTAQVHIMAAKGLLYYYQGETKKAFDFLFDAYSLASQINDNEALVRAQYALGMVHGLLGLYEQAFQYLIMAMENAHENNLEGYLGAIYNNIGVCLFNLDMIEESGDYCRLAYEYYLEKDNIQNHVYTSLNYAVYKMRSNQFKEAEDHLNEAGKYIEKLPPILSWGLKVNYARLYAYKGQYEKSLECMNQVYEEYFSGKIETAFFDHVLEWCNVFKIKKQTHIVKELLERIIRDIKGWESSTAAELMLILANLYEEDGEVIKASELFKKAVNMKSDFFKKNQQFVTNNTLKLIELTKKNQELTNTSGRDAMTGCYNRYTLQSEGKLIIDQAAEGNENIIVIMFDIDYFKQYNDFYGHLSGDNCIKSITTAVEKVLPEEKRYMYRYGGDEFLILWPLKKHNGTEIAQKLLDVVRDLKMPHLNSPVSNITTISIGVSTENKYHKNLRTAIDAADMNLYKAKFNKRNCACVDEILLLES